MKPKDFANDTFVFIYKEKIIKTITDPELVPHGEDEVIVDGFRYRVAHRLVDMDTNKIYLFLE